MRPPSAPADRASRKSAGRLASVLKERLATLAVYSTVALGFYLLSHFVPRFMTITIPGLPDPISRLDWITWAFLQLLALAFAIEAAYNLLKVVDPLFSLVSKKLGRAMEPGKRIVRDLAYALLVVLVSTVLAPLSEGLGPASGVVKAIIGLSALALLVILLYDAAKMIHAVVREKVGGAVAKLVGASE